MQITNYEFDVKLANGCELFEVEPFHSSVKNVSEMFLSSQRFPTYHECATNAMDLISTFTSFLEQITDKKFVIISKLNPTHDLVDHKDDPVDNSAWKDNIVLRMFVVDSDVLKKENKLEFTISADVSICEQDLELIHSRSGRFVQ